MIVTVHAIFSKNELIGSKIIAKGTKHLANERECSHVAVLINNRWVHESTLKTGVRVISYPEWSKINKEVERVELEPREYSDIANECRALLKKKYDKLGLIFMALCMPFTFIGFRLPKRNLLESKNKYFCCEFLGKLTGRYYSMMAPIQILADLKS